MEFADILNNWKCGGPRPDWRDEIEAPVVGDRYRVYDYITEEVSFITVTQENMNHVRWLLFSPDSDMYSLTKVPSRETQTGRGL